MARESIHRRDSDSCCGTVTVRCGVVKQVGTYYSSQPPFSQPRCSLLAYRAYEATERGGGGAQAGGGHSAGGAGAGAED